MLSDQAVDTLYRGLGVELKTGTVLSCQDLVLDEPFYRGYEASVFGGGDDGGSMAARVIVRQLRLVASAATAVFGVLNNQPLRRYASEGLG